MNGKMYKTIIWDDLMTDEALNEMATDGMNLVGFSQYGNRYAYVFANSMIENVSVSEPTKTSSTPKRFMAMYALMQIGVSEQVARDYINVRKAKRAPLTQSSFDILAKNITLAEKVYGVNADGIMRVVVDRGWQSFKVEWLENVDWDSYGIQRNWNICQNNQRDLPFDDNKWE